jgi:hypothetical protein
MPLTQARLPVRLTPLVGRERELDAIADTLTRSRLLTLTGPGGTGKTRLALAAARAAEASFSEGLGWVELAQIADPDIVGQAVASRLGVPDTPGQGAAEAVAEYMADHRVLLVLDNCEHLAGEVAKLAENLLAACPGLVILATSREALGVEGELNWQVPPLSLPSTSRRSASGSTACRWRSSWPPRGCGSFPPPSSPNGWTTALPSSSVARAPHRHGTRPCTPHWTGATTCSMRMTE